MIAIQIKKKWTDSNTLYGLELVLTFCQGQGKN